MPRTFTTDRGDRTLRLDQVIVRHLGEVPRLSRTKVQRWIAEGLVQVNGRLPARASSPVAVGDRVEVSGDEAMAERAAPQAEAQALDIIFEDAALLALNKPAGVVVHPSYKHAAGTLFNGILGHLGHTGPAGDDTPRLVHRLDKDTSGVLLVSKQLAVHRVLQRSLGDGRAAKTYLAVVHGTPRPVQGAISLPLGVDPLDRRRVAVQEGGSPSETRYERIAHGDGFSLMRCRLVTGRMHQIRVHLAASGWPIVGDQVYGRQGDAFPRQALHAWRLAIPHPVTGNPLELTAPLPGDMGQLCATLGLAPPSAWPGRPGGRIKDLGPVPTG
ncbi:MAG: RluA family pseudouridine synthase [Vicinamibacterales bacterium]